MKQLNSFLPCLNRLSLFTATAVVTIFFIGCEKDPEPLYENGIIKGSVTLYSQSSETIIGNAVKIIAHGPYGSKSTVSDNDGRYTLSGLGNGTYTLEFNKEGFGIWHIPCVRVFGYDTITQNATLYKKVDLKMPSLTSSQLITECDFSVHDWQIRLFYSDKPTVNYRNYIYTTSTYTTEVSGKAYLRYDPNPQEPNYGPIFEPGQTFYMIAYVCNENDPGYFNEFYNQVIYSSVGDHSEVFKLKCR